ncbi:MAG: T9SS type A sorting domain-containing protein [Bacteroidales bacterium]|nr:T9SS type A sorting domain-containing protein [Bacteroidales bacterium]
MMMKKQTLLLASALLATGSAWAQIEPDIWDGLQIISVSPNGQWALSADDGTGAMVVLDLVNGTYVELYNSSNFYSGGLGNTISNDGIVVGNTDSDCHVAAYYENGVWTALPLKSTDTGVNLAQGITGDGSRICGQVSLRGMTEDGLMQKPVYWERQADGTYGDYIELPHPETDFTGREPQYVTAVCISGDGRTIAGQVTDYSGLYILPIVFTQDAEGEWSWHYPYDINPNGIELPEFPGYGPTIPSPETYMTEDEVEAFEEAVEEYWTLYDAKPQEADFMTEEEAAAYQAAYDAYLADPYTHTYPNRKDYMSEESYAAYQAALSAWREALVYPEYEDYMTAEEYAAYLEEESTYSDRYDQWTKDYSAYIDALNALTADAPSFSFNNVKLSDNGRYYATTDVTADWWMADASSTPYLLDLQEGTCVEMASGSGMYSCAVSDKGEVLAASPLSDYLRHAYYAASDKDDFILLEDYIKSVDPSLYEWIEDNMVHSYDYDVYVSGSTEVITQYFEDDCLIGTPCANADFSMICSFEFNVWDYNTNEDYISYVLPINGGPLGIKSVTVKSADLQINAANGMIYLTGNASAIEVYDVNGRRLYSAANPSSAINPGLAQGIYLIKATDADGKIATAKVAF